MVLPTFRKEQILWRKGYTVIGIDEVGRGALSGPMYIGAVSFTNVKNSITSSLIEGIGINDSKKLSPRKRKDLLKIIRETAHICENNSVDAASIDKYGLTKATRLGITTLVHMILRKISEKQKPYLLIDGFQIPGIPGILHNQEGIIRGDCQSISIAAASIVAKVHRDRMMEKYALKYPGYGWERNKGYGTKDHYRGISTLGISNLHRKLFLRKYNTVTNS